MSSPAPFTAAASPSWLPSPSSESHSRLAPSSACSPAFTVASPIQLSTSTSRILALPGILLAVAIVAFLGPSLANLILALALAGWVNYARLVRAQVLTVKQREYVQAARSMGASDLHLMLRHILPNILQPLLVQAAIGMAAAVLAEATLSFLGLGVQPPTPTWGAMLNDARSHLFESPYLMFFPALALGLCVFSFNLIGDGLRDYLDPRTRLRQGL
jgi:peptide/nickel transport system permease protein